MSNLNRETVTSVHHWTEHLFSFRVTRDPAFRFKNGHFTMIGLEIGERPLLRAYSMASANYEDELEFFSIKVPGGPLTTRLKDVRAGDPILVGRKPTGTLVQDHLLPGRNLFLLSTGTGLAPFLSIIKDPDIYERFDRVILAHGSRHISDLAYQEFVTSQLPQNEYFGEVVREKLLYYPTVTREPFRNQGRLTDLLASGRLSADLGLAPLSVDDDRFMLCGSPAMLSDTTALLDSRGLREYAAGVPGHYVIERAFAER